MDGANFPQDCLRVEAGNLLIEPSEILLLRLLRFQAIDSFLRSRHALLELLNTKRRTTLGIIQYCFRFF
jgi:hypothetical protein